jgi:iron complex outermembrane receptor protein
MVLADNSVRAPGWTRIDAGMAYSHSLGGRPVMWRAGVENVFDRRAWRETPTQYGHVYLFPLAPRTWNASLRVDL